MAHLHELLAAEKDIVSKSNKLMIEGRDTFAKRHDHFDGFSKVYKANNEEGVYEEEQLTERKELVTTVDAKLRYVMAALKDQMDVRFQKDRTNCVAKADIIVNGTAITLATDVPATTLLTLEDQLRELRSVIEVIPTLEPGIEWVPAPDFGENIRITKIPQVTVRTKKQTMYKEVAKATDKHPAQVVTENVDVPFGKYTTVKFTGRISPAEKMRLMDRLEQLTIAVKQARARANETQVVPGTIADNLLTFVLGS